MDITKDALDEIAKIREAEGVKVATVNRMMSLVRAILRKAANEWAWIDKAPLVRMRKVENKRIRWINGTSLQELQMLGGWASFDMVLRYAHLSSDHLRSAANRISLNKTVTSELRV